MRRTSRRLAPDRRGVISVELALIASLILMPMTLGALDAAELVSTRSRLDQVLHQAFLYAFASHGNNVTPSSVQSAAVAGYGSGTAPTVNASITQYCITASTGYPPTGTPSQPSNGTCSTNGQIVETYLAVTVSVSVTLPFSVKWVAQTVTLSVSGQAQIA